MTCLFHGKDCWLNGADAKTTTESFTALKDDPGYGGEVFRELIDKIEELKKYVQEAAEDLNEAGYYDESDALKGMDWNAIMRLPQTKDYEYGIYKGEKVRIIMESGGRYQIFIPSRQMEVSVPVEKVERISPKHDEIPGEEYLVTFGMVGVGDEVVESRHPFNHYFVYEKSNTNISLVVGPRDFNPLILTSEEFDKRKFRLVSVGQLPEPKASQADMIDLNRVIEWLDMKQRGSITQAAIQWGKPNTALAESLERDADCWDMVRRVLSEMDAEDVLSELRS